MMVDIERDDNGLHFSCPQCGEYLGVSSEYLEERTGRLAIAKSGPCYIVYRYTCCGYEHAESKTDMGASEVPPYYCPYCGAKIEG